MSNTAAGRNNHPQELVRSIYRAVEDAKRRRHEAVTLEHLLLSILKEDDVKECLSALEVNIAEIETTMELFLDGSFIQQVDTGNNPMPTKAFDEVVTRAVGTAIFSSRAKPMPIDILVRMMEMPSEDSFAISGLLQQGLSSLMLKRFLSHGPGGLGESFDNNMMPPPGMGGDGVGAITNREEAERFLPRYCSNLNETAGQGGIDPLIGREEEVGLIVQILARRTKNNIALVGEPGVGKTAIAEGLALQISRGEVPEALAGAVVYSLDIGSLMAGTRFRGDLEERLKQVLKALEFIPTSILFIDEMHTIMGTGAGQQGSLDIANLLKPSLAKGTLKCIGSTTYEEFRKHFEKDRALMRRFKRVDVREPDIAMAKAILRGLKERYETFHGITYTDEALDAAVELTSRYINNALLPDKAIDIIDNAGARQRILPAESRLPVIDVPQIEVEVAKVARIPEQSVKEDEIGRLGSLEDDLKAAVFGQDSALLALADAVFVSRSGLRDANKPAGCFMFAGPTGVGKTEAARQLANTLGVPLVKYDMSEFMEQHSVAKLIGSPPGYTGYGDGGSGSGKLINDMEQNPHSVLLLDEIEKAHPSVYNILLQIMDDAKLTSSGGKTVDFRNVIIILTTNAGASEAAKNQIGFGRSGQGGDPGAVLSKTFSPEFRNRLDAVIQFSRLQPENVLRVVDKFFDAMRVQAAERNVKVELDDDAREWLAKTGYDPAMGARPLARAIHNHVKTPLSRLMVVGPLREGGTARVSLADNKLVVAAV